MKQQLIKLFENPKTEIDDFFENENIIWVDWREFDEDIVMYVNKFLDAEDQIEFIEGEVENIASLKYKNKEEKIVYPGKGKDRDTTIQYVAKIISDRYKLLFFAESLGNDTLGFIVLKNEDFIDIQNQFGKDTVGFLFQDVHQKMFELDMDEVFKLTDQRKKFWETL